MNSEQREALAKEVRFESYALIRKIIISRDASTILAEIVLEPEYWETEYGDYGSELSYELNTEKVLNKFVELVLDDDYIEEYAANER